MKILITGSSSGIGLAIKQELQKDHDIITLLSRFEDLKTLENELKNINELDVLIHCAGFGVFEPLENTKTKLISDLISVNLTAPILITSKLLKILKQNKGHIITIASIEATRHSKFSSIYSASKAGLRAFSLSLFEEVRKSGVKVTNINPDITKTPFFDELHFSPSKSEDTFLNTEDIAKMVRQIIEFNGVVSEVTLRPQRFEITKKEKK